MSQGRTPPNLFQLICNGRFNRARHAKRVALWRRLKGRGGIYLQNGVCLLFQD
jgi:hypothetical protein